MAGYLEIADGQVGYRGNPENVTKYWADLEPSLQGQPWCGAFVSWCLWKAGVLTAAMGGPMYSCSAMVRRARSRGQWASNPVVGALVIYDFGSGSPAHVEFVTGIVSGGINAIGGNTSGDLVARKNRSNSQILGYWHIEAPTGSIPAGTGDAGYSYITYGEYVAAPAQTVVGEAAGPAGVRFGKGAFRV